MNVLLLILLMLILIIIIVLLVNSLTTNVPLIYNPISEFSLQ